MLAEEGRPELSQEETQRWLLRCERDHDNLRQAHDWLVTAGKGEWALRMAIALYWFWERRDHWAEGRTRLLAAVRMHRGKPPSQNLARAIGFAAALAVSQGDYESAKREENQAQEMHRDLEEARDWDPASNDAARGAGFGGT
jgi:hypothetical protein